MTRPLATHDFLDRLPLPGVDCHPGVFTPFHSLPLPYVVERIQLPNDAGTLIGAFTIRPLEPLDPATTQQLSPIGRLEIHTGPAPAVTFGTSHDPWCACLMCCATRQIRAEQAKAVKMP